MMMTYLPRAGRRMLFSASLLACLIPAIPAMAQTSGTPAEVSRKDTVVGLTQPVGNTFLNFANFNPYAPGNEPRNGLAYMLEPLFYYSTLKPELIPWLATGYAFNADMTGLTITLREGTKWSDGKPITADDVKFTVEWLQANPSLRWSAELKATVASVTAKDAQTVVFAFNGPQPRFLHQFLAMYFNQGIWILPKHVFETATDAATFTASDPAKGWPVVSGAYNIVDGNAQRIMLDRRDDWWGNNPDVWKDQKGQWYASAPTPKRIINLPWRDVQAAAREVAAGQADWAIETSVPLMREVLSRYPNLTTYTGKDAPYGYVDYFPTSLWFNQLSPLVSDKRVRQAIEKSVDADQAIAIVHEGASKKLWAPFADFPAVADINAEAQKAGEAAGMHKLDRDGAAKLMQEAGYQKDSGGFWAKDGKRWSAKILTSGAFEGFIPVIIEQMRRSGFEVVYTKRPDFRPAIYSGLVDLYVWGHDGNPAIDPYDVLSGYLGKWRKPIGEIAARPHRWSNPDFDAIVNKIGTLPVGDPKIKDLTIQALNIWRSDVVEVPLAQWYHRVPMNTSYWTGWPDAKNPYIPPTVSYWTAPLVLHGLKKAQ